MDELKALLAASDCYVFTINGFPYGPSMAAGSRKRSISPTGATRSG